MLCAGCGHAMSAHGDHGCLLQVCNCHQPALQPKQQPEQKPVDTIRGQVFSFPGTTATGRTRYSYIVFCDVAGKKTILSTGTGEWGVCLLVALSEVTRFRASGAERGDSGGGIAENIPESFELRHPVVGYRVKEHMLQKVAGFQDVKTAREWIRR